MWTIIKREQTDTGQLFVYELEEETDLQNNGDFFRRTEKAGIHFRPDGVRIWVQMCSCRPDCRRDRAVFLHETAYALLWKGIKDWDEGRHNAADFIPAENRFRLCKTDNGKPYLSGTYAPKISLSHTDGSVAVILPDLEAGIDVERIKPYPERIVKRVLSEEEQLVLQRSKFPEELFFRFWTLKEAYGKATGKGIAYNMPEITFTPAETYPDGGVLPEKVEAVSENSDLYDFYQLKIEDYIISFCRKKRYPNKSLGMPPF